MARRCLCLRLLNRVKPLALTGEGQNHAAVIVALPSYGQPHAPLGPLAELERRPQITSAVSPLPVATGGGFYARWPDGDAVVVVDAGRSRIEQTAILTHELVHDERGGGCPCIPDAPPEWHAVVAREEAHVARQTARRLVPPEELVSFVERVVELDEAVTSIDVAEAFATTEGAAHVALSELRRRMPRR